MLSNVSHKDAKAAVKVWAQTVAKERKIAADPACLQSALDLLTDHDRLCARTNGVEKGIRISAHDAGQETQQ